MQERVASIAAGRTRCDDGNTRSAREGRGITDTIFFSLSLSRLVWPVCICILIYIKESWS